MQLHNKKIKNCHKYMVHMSLKKNMNQEVKVQ